MTNAYAKSPNRKLHRLWFRVRQIAQRHAAHGADNLQAFRKILQAQVVLAAYLLARPLAFRFSTP